jgi:DNA-binding Lrp family transcriptional regulator
MKLTALDRRIIYRIQREPYLDDAEIAEKLEVPTRKVSARIRRLERAGIIMAVNRKAAP